MNPYLDDAARFMRLTAIRVTDDLDEDEALIACICFALGMERVLKGILFGLNPTYVLKKPDFGNSIQILYSRSILPHADSKAEFDKSADSDVITFRQSLLRAQAISSTAYRHKNILFALSAQRDILAHRPTAELEAGKVVELIVRDFYVIASAFADELDIPRSKWFGPPEIRVAEVSQKHQKTAEERLKIKLDAHRVKWRTLSGNAGYVEDKLKTTEQVLETAHKFSVPCPACGNTAVLYTAPAFETNPYTGEQVIVDAVIRRMKCLYCKFEIADANEIDLLKLSEAIKPPGGTALPIIEAKADQT